MGRYPSFLGLGLVERIAVALLELSLEFGVQDSRGVLIRIALTQGQLADLVGASRAKVGQVLLDLERQKIVVREGHQLAVLARRLEALVRSHGQTAAWKTPLSRSQRSLSRAIAIDRDTHGATFIGS